MQIWQVSGVGDVPHSSWLFGTSVDAVTMSARLEPF
jgi:hypothetical protein